MKALALQLVPNGDVTHPMHEFVAEHSAYGATRLLQSSTQDDGTTVFLFYIDGPQEPFLSALDDAKTAEVATPSPAVTDGFYLYVQEHLDDHTLDLVSAFAEENVLVIPPVVYDVDGTIRVTVVGVAAAVQRAVDRMPDSVDASVLRLWSGANKVVHRGNGLTERQREVVATAFETGYYEEPREATIADVAERLDCAQSTVAEHLRKAESTLVRHEIGSYLTEGGEMAGQN
jgi:predicted DNA binding protein